MADAFAGMALSLLRDMHLETYLSYRGGQELTFTWRTPMATFESAARLFRMLSGGGASPAPATPAP
jgi:hypothetical protein